MFYNDLAGHVWPVRQHWLPQLLGVVRSTGGEENQDIDRYMQHEAK